MNIIGWEIFIKYKGLFSVFVGRLVWVSLNGDFMGLEK